MKYLILIIPLLFNNAYLQTLRINEFSNGPTGSNKEWVEILVVPTTPTSSEIKTCFKQTINVGGWLLDDNNSDFSPANRYFGSGVQNGHLRFKNVAPWTKLPIGALIVIYNSSDIDPLLPSPPLIPDVYDVNQDCTYFIPDSSSVLEYCTNAPSILNCSTRLNYNGCTSYSNYDFITGRTWASRTPLTNDGDGIQIRDNLYNLVHGVVYGRTSTSSSCGTTAVNLVGNSFAPYITTSPTSGSNTYYAYNGLDLNGYYDPTKWTYGNASFATPGKFNNANNEIWIKDTIKKGCICDVVLNFDTTRVHLIRQLEKSLIIQQTKNRIIFKSDNLHNIRLSLFQLDGRLLNVTDFWFKGIYYFNRPEGFFIVNISVSTGFGTFYTKSFKIF